MSRGLGCGWWYAATVIDDSSRYLLALHQSPSHGAGALTVALDQAIAEAERGHGPLERTPSLVADNGSNFLARPSGSTSRAGSARCARSTARRTSSGCSSASTRRSSRGRSTGRSTAPRPRPATAWPPCASATTTSGRTGRCDRLEVAIPSHPPTSTAAGGEVEIPAWQQWAKEAKAKLEAVLQEEAEAA